MCSVMQCFKAM